jgi:TolB-like protein
MNKAAYKAKCESFCATNNYATAKIAYERFNQVWDEACQAVERFVKEQGPRARLANGLTADYVKTMPEYKRLSAIAYQAGEECKTFNGVYTRVFAREHKAAIVASRESRAKDNGARWSALCATA